jgi:NitT/TauT family transport system ATP-binding protein
MADDEKKAAEGPGAPLPGPGLEGAAAAAPAPKTPPSPADLAAAEAALKAFEKAQAAEPSPAQTPPAVERARARERARELPEAKARPPVVLFDKVTKTYGAGTGKAFTAIKDVSFVVEDLPAKGEFVCLLGPSGCGKSTVLRMIAGLEPQFPPTEGRVEVLGRPVSEPGADRGMVFQAYTSFDNRTVLRNVAFGLECQGVPRRQREELARDWIAKVGLSVENDAGKYPHELSGGMQQRVAIARTLILKPRIILMDEPFGALDPIIRTQMQDTLIQLWREVEATVFFVTHSIEEAVFLGDRAYLFSNSPGTILREFKIPPADRPAREMQRSAQFQQVVFELRDIIDRLEHEQAIKRQAARG